MQVLGFLRFARINPIGQCLLLPLLCVHLSLPLIFLSCHQNQDLALSDDPQASTNNLSSLPLESKSDARKIQIII